MDYDWSVYMVVIKCVRGAIGSMIVSKTIDCGSNPHERASAGSSELVA